MGEAVGEVTRHYLELADAALPGRVEGLYLVGSVAFEDFSPEVSDVDFVAVTATPLTPDEVLVLGDVHAELRAARPAPALEGAYVTWAELAADPTGLVAVPHHRDGRVSTGAGGAACADPLRWHTLATRPVAVRGPAAPTVWADGAALRRWALAALNGGWAEWVERQEKLVNRGTMQMPDRALARGVLGIPRLHHTFVTGEVASTTAAGAYALATFDAEWAPIVTEALHIRLGEERSEEYRRRPLARRRDALGFMAHVIDDANARPSPDAPPAAPGPGPGTGPAPGPSGGGAAGGGPGGGRRSSPLDVAAPLAPPPADAPS